MYSNFSISPPMLLPPSIYSSIITAIYPSELLPKTLLWCLTLDPLTSGYHLLNVPLIIEPVVSKVRTMLNYEL